MQGAIPLGVLVVSGVLYHVAQKSAGPMSPWPMLTVAYGAAFVIALVLSLLNADVTPSPRARTAGLLLGLAAFGIEAGFFFIYRAGWPLASASVIANASVTIILAVVGTLAFGEALTLYRVTGIALAASGAGLIARGA